MLVGPEACDSLCCSFELVSATQGGGQEILLPYGMGAMAGLCGFGRGA